MSTEISGESSRGIHRLQCVGHCEFKFGMEYLLGLEPIEPRKPLARGTCIHEGLAAYYEGREPAEMILSVPEKLAFAANESLIIVTRYARRYPVHRDGSNNLCEELGRVLFTEKEFAYKIGEQVFTRKLDLGIATKNDTLIIVDHKGASRPSERAKTALLEPALFTQEIVGRWVVAPTYGLKWGGVCLNVIPTGNNGDFTRPMLSWPQEFLVNRALPSIEFWAVREQQIVSDFDAGRLDPWRLPRSFSCYQHGFPCDMALLCREGDLALSRYQAKQN
jgi:hypothetical protein